MRSPRPHRARMLLPALLLLSGCVGVPPADREPREPPAERSAPHAVRWSATAEPAVSRAAEVLRRWDRARARAFAGADVPALRELYVRGSRAGTADVRLLRRYRRRGLRVDGMTMQLLSVEVLDESPGRLRLRVTDRLARAVAVGRGAAVPLPTDRASTRVLELRRRDGRWRMAWVRP